jgi:gliding motility-associated-like protein
MRKCLLLVALLIVSQFNTKAQKLFEAPDTVCVRQPIQLTTLAPNASSHFWGFCSGYMFNDATGTNMGKSYGLNGPVDIDIVKDGDNYYGFVITASVNEFVKLDFGTSLSNVPKVYNYGTFDNAMPVTPNCLYVVKDEAKGNWHVFIAAGSNPATSEMARVDFGTSLDNTPNIVNFGNVGGVLNAPKGLFIAKEGDKWYGFCMNAETLGKLVKIEFDTNISLTPVNVLVGPMNGFTNYPSDMEAVYENGNWYFFVTNAGNGAIIRIDVGSSLAAISSTTPPGDNFMGNPNDRLNTPDAISIIRDCDSLHAFITNKASHELVRVDMASVTGPLTARNFGNIGSFNAPVGLSRFIRDRSDIYAFIVNNGDSSITRVAFEQCTNSNISYSGGKIPPPYSYNAPGLYNVYYAINEGLPTMQVNCQQIRVMPIPSILLSKDTTICQGDTILRTAFSLNAISYTWTPNHNISATDKADVLVWPQHSVSYRINLPFPDGCIVDTVINVEVMKIKADAGPDREIKDGAQTVLGGPFTTVGPNYSYSWKPAQYIDDRMALNPTVNPPYNFTYYLEVRNPAGCLSVDTVLVRVPCDDIAAPNAFAPNNQSSASSASFGLMNAQFIRLTYFSIYDRWGKEVFTTTDPLKRWDGMVNGTEAPMGVYIWQAEGFCTSGQKLKKSGNVTLIR